VIVGEPYRVIFPERQTAVSKDDVIRKLAEALNEALICGWVEPVVKPPYRVPDSIDGDRWHWVHTSDRDKACSIITTAIKKACQCDQP
jgi:hypothetical protein